jgi:hypothetical protein
VAALHAFADTWSALYSNSPAIRSLLAFLHIGGLVAAGGVAVTADVATLKALARGSTTLRLELERLHATHRLVIVSLALVVVSGVLLMFADLDAYLHSTAFWMKMTLVAALLGNGGLLVSAGRPDKQTGTFETLRLRIVSIASLALWFGTTLLGAILPNAV